MYLNFSGKNLTFGYKCSLQTLGQTGIICSNILTQNIHFFKESFDKTSKLRNLKLRIFFTTLNFESGPTNRKKNLRNCANYTQLSKLVFDALNMNKSN